MQVGWVNIGVVIVQAVSRPEKFVNVVIVSPFCVILMGFHTLIEQIELLAYLVALERHNSDAIAYLQNDGIDWLHHVVKEMTCIQAPSLGVALTLDVLSHHLVI